MANEVLSRNLSFLMRLKGWNQVETAKRAHVDQKVISYVLRQAKTPGIDVVDKIAAAFGLSLWHFMTPTLPEDMSGQPSIAEIYQEFFACDQEGKKLIAQIAHIAHQKADKHADSP